MQTVNQALSILRNNAKPLPPREIPLAEALNLELAEPVAMDIDAPPFSRALVDGYAIVSESKNDGGAGTVYKIIGKLDAGANPHGMKISPGQCAAINTGAPIPDGADAVAMVEHTQRVGDDGIQLNRPVKAGDGIQRQAADAKSGDVVLHPGTTMTPAALAVAAAAGRAFLKIKNPRPVVALLVTGDELVPIDHLPGPGQIRNSNQTLLAALIEQTGARLMDLGVSRDEPIALRLELARGLTEADLLLVAGGMSMGTKDLVPKLLFELGVQPHIEKLKMRPGKPFVFGTVEEAGVTRYVCGLPGNPVSAFVCFCRLVAPLLAELSTAAKAPQIEKAIAGDDLPANTDREFYQPCALSNSIATPLHWRGSADLFTLARAHALIIHPINSPARPKGTEVDILRLKA